MVKYQYIKNTPRWMIVVLAVIVIFSFIPLMNLIILGFNNLTIDFSKKTSLEQLGQFGDFFGGHMAAFTGSTSLVVIVLSTFHQAKQQKEFFEEQSKTTKNLSDRQFFIDGINLIAQWDISASGCDQCMRLLDYYGRIALVSEDKELLLLLNTVITAQIRKNLEGKNGSFKQTNYPYACDAVEKIKELREKENREYKKIKRDKANNPSIPQFPEG
jgi:hypothetical protein